MKFQNSSMQGLEVMLYIKKRNTWTHRQTNEPEVICPSNFFVCLFVLKFYGPVNPMGSCRARSVYLTTRLLGRLSPLNG